MIPYKKARKKLLFSYSRILCTEQLLLIKLFYISKNNDDIQVLILHNLLIETLIESSVIVESVQVKKKKVTNKGENQ